MEAIEGNTNIAKTECGHSFHFQCLIRWSQNHDNCPMCRQDFVKEEPEPEVDLYARHEGETDIQYIEGVTCEDMEKIEQALRYYKGDVQKTITVMDSDSYRRFIVDVPPNVEDIGMFDYERTKRYWIPPFNTSPTYTHRPIGKEFIYQTRTGKLATKRSNFSRLRHDLGVKGDPLEAGYRSS
jgi:hypothetical protein